MDELHTKSSSGPLHQKLLKGILRWHDDPIWNVQITLFFIGASIELMLISALLVHAEKMVAPKQLLSDPFFILYVIPIWCATPAILHQFLILRNLELDRDNRKVEKVRLKVEQKAVALAGPSSGEDKKEAEKDNHSFYMVMISVFFLATVTGEVPYLLSLSLFNLGPSSSLFRVVDYLGIFANCAKPEDVTPEKLKLFWEEMFLTASVFLCFFVILWDLLEPSNRRITYCKDPNVKVFSVFISSDLPSLLIWALFLGVLFIRVLIEVKGFSADEMKGSLAICLVLIMISTLMYSRTIMRRLHSSCRVYSADTLHESIV